MNDAEVIHGDCLDVLRGMDAGSVDLIVTDPPFGARRPSAWRTASDRFDEIEGNSAVWAEWLSPAFDVLKDGGAAYVFTCWDKMEEWRTAMRAAGFRVRSCIVWDKCIHGLADLETCWAPQHEFILFGAKGRHELRGKRPKDVLQVPRIEPAKLVHPYQKPVRVVLPLIRASSGPGELVVDPFTGSGAVGEACSITDRRFVGVESDPTYVAIARRRIAEVNNEIPLFAGVA